ncbi:MAG: segregation/condensation protein A [Candidatus Nanoarchaeia archaeon]|nr:segregation/condensation protein A [Candidatus Nanoarchaeia archaeon]
MQDRLLDMLMKKDELTWQTIIQDLVKSEQMNPWDVDISLLSRKYLDIVKGLQEHNFFISGKVILAAAILLKIKSHKFLNEDMTEFDAQLFRTDEDLLDDEGYIIDPITKEVIPDLLIKTPQARKRRIDLNDLMSALDTALKVEHKRIIRKKSERVINEVELPTKKIDITKLIKSVYNRIVGWFSKKEKVTFSELVGDNPSRDNKIYTFMPLLYLSNNHDIDLHQKVPFGEIDITKYDANKQEVLDEELVEITEEGEDDVE